MSYCDVRSKNRKIFIYIIIKNRYLLPSGYSSRAVIDKVQNLKYAYPHNILSIFDKRSAQVMRVRVYTSASKKPCVNRYYWFLVLYQYARNQLCLTATEIEK